MKSQKARTIKNAVGKGKPFDRTGEMEFHDVGSIGKSASGVLEYEPCEGIGKVVVVQVPDVGHEKRPVVHQMRIHAGDVVAVRPFIVRIGVRGADFLCARQTR